MLDGLLLLSGNDIPFPKGQITIHQPTLKEIGYIGEQSFFTGCELLNFSKNLLSTEDKTVLENTSNFEVFMSIMRDKKDTSIQKHRVAALMVLSLLFPTYQIAIEAHQLTFKPLDESDGGAGGRIFEDNFKDFQEIVQTMFYLSSPDEQEYNPQSEAARKIAEKLAKGKEKIAKDRGEKEKGKKIDVLSRYMSVLAIAEQKTFNELSGYTVYQLYDAFDRYQLKDQNDIYIKEKLAGAKDVKEPDNWMKDIHAEGANTTNKD